MTETRNLRQNFKYNRCVDTDTETKTELDEDEDEFHLCNQCTIVYPLRDLKRF